MYYSTKLILIKQNTYNYKKNAVIKLIHNNKLNFWRNYYNFSVSLTIDIVHAFTSTYNFGKYTTIYDNNKYICNIIIHPIYHAYKIIINSNTTTLIYHNIYNINSKQILLFMLCFKHTYISYILICRCML